MEMSQSCTKPTIAWHGIDIVNDFLQGTINSVNAEIGQKEQAARELDDAAHSAQRRARKKKKRVSLYLSPSGWIELYSIIWDF